MSRWTAAQITAKGNPSDVPFEVLRKARKRQDGHECYSCGRVNPMNLVERRFSHKPDAFDNLRTVCRSCHSEDVG